MDKIRAFMQVLWVQRFWVLSVVGVLAAAVCWMMAAGKLQAEYAADKTAILAKFGEMDKIKKAPFHGNDGVNAKEREEAAKIAENVKGLWQKLYENQREKVLFWPESLGQEFVEYIDKRKFDQNISPVMRDRYLNYISTRFDALVDIVDAQKLAPGATGGAFGGEGGYRGGEGGAMTPQLGSQGMWKTTSSSGSIRMPCGPSSRSAARRVPARFGYGRKTCGCMKSCSR